MAHLTNSDGTVIQISKETEVELRVAFGPKPKPKFGDVVKYNRHRRKESSNRVALYNQNGQLKAFSCASCAPYKPYEQTGLLDYYTPTGQNIFTNDLLDLS